MEEITKNKATICVVNYKTLDLTRLCLRSLRVFTRYRHEVLVIDNGSNDESTQYLRSLKWIRLIERDTSGDISGGQSHARALDLGLQNCNNEFFVSLHSDTFVKQLYWLNSLVAWFEDDPNIACVGSGKLELTPAWQQALKAATDFRTIKRKLFNEPDPLGKHRYYNRTICCMYRTEILRKENLTFDLGCDDGLTAGKKLYFELQDRGYKTIELAPHTMSKYVTHLAHATQVINPAEFNLPGKTTRKIKRLIKKVMSNNLIQQIMQDDALDK